MNTDKSPLVSCIMPTKNRAHFIHQSIRYFQDQSYTNTELIIVYDSVSDLPINLKVPNNIRLMLAQKGNSIGAKRNMACENALGDIIVHWDDDDWYSNNRILEQVKPIINNACDITALNNSLFYITDVNEFWKCSDNLSKKMLIQNVHGGTLAYKKEFWNNSNRYPDTSLREDADFMLDMIEHGAKLKKIDGEKLFIYLRHDNNSWVFKTGRYLDSSEWEKVSRPTCIAKDIAFYLNMNKKVSEVGKLTACQCINKKPQVSCIMPTANRREFIPQAIKYFKDQSYPHKELIIIDDGTDKIEDLIDISDTQIIYHSLDRANSVGYKRNMACGFANGSIIIHWDDDDWMSRDWIEHQVDHLLAENADVTGLNQPYFFQLEDSKYWQYKYPKSEKPWVHGGTLCYTKKLWQRNPFKDINIGEDVYFLWSNCPKKIIPHQCIDHYLGVIHDTNTSQKNTFDQRWIQIMDTNINPKLEKAYV